MSREALLLAMQVRAWVASAPALQTQHVLYYKALESSKCLKLVSEEGASQEFTVGFPVPSAVADPKENNTWC